MIDTELTIKFRYANFGNIACMSVIGDKTQNDINDEEAIMLFNSLIGCKDRNIKSLQQENTQKQELLDIANNKLSKIKEIVRQMAQRFDQDNYKGVSRDDDILFEDILSIIGSDKNE